ncbi:nuclear pore complex protein NUP1-like isoform X2 [Syzygium oleosum]|uniref:nuclear pore complex protein NUP1-like isoform X2 n=1 Tax=Syzygium oleosum TaxID=219896 RepID=UPI0024BB7AE0|nr:nuclear pore complex protein NUP1-like isoform X2 [Syzygium oleosum]
MQNDGDAAAAAASQQPEPGRGAGGKVRRPPNRNPRATPYARPNSNRPQAGGGGGGGGGWLSKLVDPAYRLISGGATRMLPSLFSRPPSPVSLPPLSDEDEDEDDGLLISLDKSKREIDQDVRGSNHEGNSDLGLSRSAEVGNAVASDVPKRTVFDGYKEFKTTHNKVTDLPKDTALSEIEQLIRGKMFSRDEISRLTEILKSKTVDLPKMKERENNSEMNAVGEVEVHATVPHIPSKTNGGEQGVLNRALWEVSTPLHHSNLRDEIGASPVDIARAYMGSRTSEVGSILKSNLPEDPKALLHGDGYLHKPFSPSPLPKSSVCWPGSVVQDRYLTPQTQRGSHGTPTFHRTPYSRPVLSMSKSKVRFREDELHGDHGSIGPIRSSRQKFVTGSAQKFSSFPSLVGSSQRETIDFRLPSLPAFNKNMEAGGTSSSSKSQSLENKSLDFEVGVPTVPTHSSQMARKILEHLDRSLPSPKDKAVELKEASLRKKSESSDVAHSMSSSGNLSYLSASVKYGKADKTNQMNAALPNGGTGTSFFRVPAEENVTKTANAAKRRFSGSDEDICNGIPIPGVNNTASLDSGVADKFVFKSTDKDVSKELPSFADSRGHMIPKKPASGSKAPLPSISIDKPQVRATVSSDNSGFTFPISASRGMFPEPPTPSITPPSFVNSLHQPQEDSAIPSYTFGLRSSSPALVFSFPSTSNASIPSDASDLKFTFGSDKKRISFSSIGNDSICC